MVEDLYEPDVGEFGYIIRGLRGYWTKSNIKKAKYNYQKWITDPITTQRPRKVHMLIEIIPKDNSYQRRLQIYDDRTLGISNIRPRVIFCLILF